MMFKYLPLMGLLFTLTACAVPGERARGHTFDVADHYSRQHEGRDIRARKWWRLYNDPALNSMVERALLQNPSLAQVRARVRQARAAAGIGFGERLPSLDLSFNRSASRGDLRSPSELSFSAAAQYEIDVWGKNYARYRADEIESEASYEDLRAAFVTLSASIVEQWLNVLAAREQEALIHEQIQLNNKILDLQKNRFFLGGEGALGVFQQKEVVAGTKAQLADIQATQELAFNQLALLTGEMPAQALRFEGARIPDPLPLPRTGLPSELLEYRPDIRASWLRVSAADWAAGAARADRLPSFTIGSTFSTDGRNLGELFKVWFLQNVLGASFPVFDGGQRYYAEMQARALADERFHQYREIVLNAVKEVEDALTNENFQRRKIKDLAQQIADSENSLKQAQIAYAQGTESYINVLNSLINLQGLQLQFIAERRDLALARVSLYRALGGTGWIKPPFETMLARAINPAQTVAPPQDKPMKRTQGRLAILPSLPGVGDYLGKDGDV